MNSLGKQWLKPWGFPNFGPSCTGPMKCCSTIAQLRWWVESFLTNNFAVATPMSMPLIIVGSMFHETQEVSRFGAGVLHQKLPPTVLYTVLALELP